MHPSTTIDLRALEGGETSLTLSVSGPDLDIPAEDLSFVGPVVAALRLVPGADTVQVRGTVSGTTSGTCARCGEEVIAAFGADLNLVAIPRPHDVDPDEPVDDEDLLYYEGSTLGLGEAIREVVLVEQPMAVLCQEACQGLCPQCGVNLNETSCSCERPSTDPRWQALQDAMKDRERE
jgi:uncharacterized protein